MRKLLAFFLVLCVVFAASTVSADSIPEEVLSQIDKVFYVETQDRKSVASGTAFLIADNDDGSFLLTNYHVVELNLDNVVVWTGSGQVTQANVVAKDERFDLAVLRTTATIHEKPVVFSTEASRGSAVYAVGFPGDAEYLSNSALRTSQEATITDGVISAIRSAQIVSAGPSVGIIQTNASINHGNSGGPLFDQNGFVVGVNTYGVSSGIFGAISSSSVLDFLKENDLIGIISLNNAAHQSANSNSEKAVGLIWPFVALGIIVLTAIAILVMALKGKGKRAGKKKAEMPLFEYVSMLTEPLSDADIVTMLMPVAKELREKHAEGLVHAGISSHSIIASKKGCLIDPKYRQGAFVASEFVAPEQQSGKGASVKTDVYSFCRLLEYMRRAGVKDTPLLDNEEPLDDTISVTPKDESVLSEVIHKGTREAAEDRFSSMQDIIYALAGLNISSLSSIALVPFSGKKSMSSSPQRKTKLWIPIAIGSSLLILSFVANQIVVERKMSKAADAQDYDSIAHLYPNYYFPGQKIKKYLEFYSAGVDLSSGNYSDAYLRFIALGDFHDSVNLAKESRYLQAKELLSYGKYEEAKKVIADLADYKDTISLEKEIRYQQAMNQLSAGLFDDAKSIFADLADYQDAEAMVKECDYQKAAFLAEKDDFEAAIELYVSLGNYKDSADLVFETKAERGLSYLDAKQYEKALAEFTALKKDGWADASEGINLTYYVWGNDLAKDKKYIAAYDKLSSCRDYKDTSIIRNRLKETIYQQGQTYYRNKNLDKAKECFNVTGKKSVLSGDISYLRSEDYLFLIDASKKADTNWLSVSDIRKLTSLIGFENAATIIMRSHNGATSFLEGTWRGSNYYFTMSSDRKTSYNLPFFEYGNYYKIENGKVLLYNGNTPSVTKTLFTITIIDKNTISVLCAQDGKTYTLKKD